MTGLTPTFVCTNLPGVQARRRFFFSKIFIFCKFLSCSWFPLLYVYNKTVFYLNSLASRFMAGRSHVGHELNLIRCVGEKVGKKMVVAGVWVGFKKAYQYARKTVD